MPVCPVRVRVKAYQPIGEFRSVPDLLARSDRSFARTQHRMRTIKLWILSIAGCVYAGALVLNAIAFATIWRGGDWLEFWAGFMAVGPMGTGLANIAVWQDSRANLFVPVAELRQAIYDGDDTTAPVAEASPGGARDVSADAGRLGQLRRRIATGTVATLWGIAALVLVVFFVGVPLALGAGNSHLALLLAAAGLPSGLVCMLLGWRCISPLFVRIEPTGLRWRRPLGLTAFVAWRDVKRFFSLTYAVPLANHRETLYVLDGGGVTLAWRADADATATASQASLQLRQLITEFTGLPLRDVTAQAKRIAQVSTTGAPHTSAGVSVPAITFHLSRKEVSHRLRVAGVVLSPFLALALVSLVAMLVQAPYYEHLYLQAHAHAPLYRDALTHADGEWPDNAFSHFDQGVYRFQQPTPWDYLTYVAAPHRYDHALVEVSGRTGGSFELGGVGLAIAGPGSTTRLLTFTVAPKGSWWIENMSKTEAYEANRSMRFDEMSAIHRGFGVSNRIAVLINGADFIFYVNGHYATGYHDDALKDGQVCLFMGITTPIGDFTNFAVYPV